MKKLSIKDYVYLGSMLFGLFFGAGNLIFPVHLGQESGKSVFLANLGFLTTGIGLPFLSIIAIGCTQSTGVFKLAKSVSRIYAYIFTVLLYLVIAPFFALPRLSTTSFEIGIAPFVSCSLKTFTLLIFNILFFLIAYLFALNPSKLLYYIGKILNPLFLLLLGILLVSAFIHPMGSVNVMTIQPAYKSHPFWAGFAQGYNTLDALAALAFGIIIVKTLRDKGVTSSHTITVEIIKAGAISIFLMGIIYSLLSYIGTLSLGRLSISSNGGVALAQIAKYYFGGLGNIILAFIIILACLKTAIGLISAFSETFVQLFPKRNYIFFSTLVSAIACLLANIGLTKIIEYSFPILMILYPLAIILILLGIIGTLIELSSFVYQLPTYFVLPVSIIDGLNACPISVRKTSVAKGILTLGEKIPFFSIGMGWILPAFMGFLIAISIHLLIRNYNSNG